MNINSALATPQSQDVYPLNKPSTVCSETLLPVLRHHILHVSTPRFEIWSGGQIVRKSCAVDVGRKEKQLLDIPKAFLLNSNDRASADVEGLYGAVTPRPFRFDDWSDTSTISTAVKCQTPDVKQVIIYFTYLYLSRWPSLIRQVGLKW